MTKLESFSNNQWNLIFTLVEEVAKNPRNRGYRPQKHKIDLGKLNDISYRYIEFLKNDANVNVGGCFDNKLFLHFSGFQNSEEKLIEITWGESPLKKKNYGEVVENNLNQMRHTKPNSGLACAKTL